MEERVMTLIRWNPRAGRELARFHNEFDRMFDDLVGRAWQGDLPATFLPPIDLEENAEGFVLRADLPGMSQKDVSVRLVGETLIIAGERKHQTTGNDATTHHKERVVGRFERSLNLGTRVRADQVEASFRDGVLEVRIPKADEARVREIEVKVG
jgi:HSP20 family protein